MRAPPEILKALADAIRPLERLSPSAFAERFREIKPGAGPFSGPWRNDRPFPYLVGIMDVVQEALEEGRQGCVLMKSTQGGGTDAWGVNATLWLLTYYPGPILYLTSKDDVAREFVRDRWDFASSHCEPVAKKALKGKRSGELVQVKRYLDGKLVLSSSRSVLNLLSQPYPFVEIDELDSAQEQTKEGDLVALALKRTTAYKEAGPTLVLAWAHPTVRESGTARLYYERSDQRRGHVECPHCKTWIAPRWDHVRALPLEGESPAAAARDASRYAYVSPCCGVEWTDADRIRAIAVVEQRSTLPPEVAAKREWIGVHFWAFFQPAMSVRELAKEFIAGLDDPAAMRVFWNKSLGEPYAEKLQDVSVEAWARLALELGEPRSFRRGEVPAAAQWLTGGQDSRAEELHWTVWAWGLERTVEKGLVLNGWLVDWGVEPGPRSRDPRAQTLEASDLRVFDQVLYDQFWPRVGDEEDFVPLAQVFHDSGWQPSAVYEFCRERLARAVPSKGAAVDDRSPAPTIKWSRGLKFSVGGQEVDGGDLRRADINTYRAKLELAGLIERTFRDVTGAPRSRLTLPADAAGDLILDHLASEKIERDKRGRRHWVKKGPNHWWDCSVMAYASAWNIHQAILADAVEREVDLATRAEELLRSGAGSHAPEDDDGPPPQASRIRSRY